MKKTYRYSFYKKVGNLTVRQLVRICKNKQCPNCPLSKFCCFNFQAFEDYLERKVYVSFVYDRQVKSKK